MSKQKELGVTATVGESGGKQLCLTVKNVTTNQTSGPTIRITLENRTNEDITTGGLDPFLWLRDPSGNAMEMTEFGKTHFFNAGGAGSNFGGYIPAHRSIEWNAEIDKCFVILKPGPYFLDVEYVPQDLSNFGLAGIPVWIGRN